MNNTLRKLGLAVLSSVLVMSAGAYAGEDSDLIAFGDLYEEALGDAITMFEDFDAEGSDSLSAEDSFTFEGDLIALDDLGISVTVKNYDIAKQDENGWVRIYTQGEFIPFVMVKRFDTGWDVLPNGFDQMYTEVMQEDYPDVRVADAAYTMTLSGREFLRIRYEYTISGFTASDTRLFCQWNNSTFMFGSKEIVSRGDVLPDGFLEQIAASMAPLAGGAADYPKHVSSTETAYGPGPSVGQMGGYNTGTDGGGTGTDGSGKDGGGSGGPTTTVGGPVGSGGPVGRKPSGGATGSITFDENAADYQGVWVDFEDGFRLYLPTTWNTYNLTQEQYNSGIFYMAGDTSGSAAPAGIGVSYGEKGDLTLEQIAQMFEEDGCQVDGIISVNNLLCVSYLSEEEDCCGLIFFHPEGLDYFFMVEAFDYSSNVDTLASVLCSLSPTV